MIRMYCAGHHQSSASLCESCRELGEYAQKRISKCPYGEGKPACSDCPTHCYVRQKRQQIQEVMRYAGPRMIWRHPWLAIMHLLDSKMHPARPAK